MNAATHIPASLSDWLHSQPADPSKKEELGIKNSETSSFCTLTSSLDARTFHVTAVDNESGRILLADKIEAPNLPLAYGLALLHLAQEMHIPRNAVRITNVSEQPA